MNVYIVHVCVWVYYTVLALMYNIQLPRRLSLTCACAGCAIAKEVLHGYNIVVSKFQTQVGTFLAATPVTLQMLQLHEAVKHICEHMKLSDEIVRNTDCTEITTVLTSPAFRMPVQTEVFRSREAHL